MSCISAVKKYCKALIVNIAGRFVNGNPRKLSCDLSQARILFMRFGGLGDAVTCLPVLENLRRRYPRSKASVWCSSSNCEIFDRCEWVDECIVGQNTLWGQLRLYRTIRTRDFDVVIDLTIDRSAKNALLGTLLNRRAYRIGMNKCGAEPFYDKNIHVKSDAHMVQRTASVLKALDAYPEELEWNLKVNDEDIDYARAFISFNFRKGDQKTPVIGINISAGRPTRYWCIVRYMELVNLLTERFPEAAFLVFCARRDYDDAQKLIETSPCRQGMSKSFRGEHRWAVIGRNISLTKVCGLLSQLTFLITPDTGLVHLASVLKVPVVGLYQNRELNLKRWAPWGVDYEAIMSNSKDDTLQDIEPQAVADVAFKLSERIKIRR